MTSEQKSVIQKEPVNKKRRGGKVLLSEAVISVEDRQPEPNQIISSLQLSEALNASVSRVRQVWSYLELTPTNKAAQFCFKTPTHLDLAQSDHIRTSLA